LILEQHDKLLNDDLPDCTGILSATFGLPCSHALKAALENDEASLEELIDHQWMLELPSPQSLPVDNPPNLTPRKLLMEEIRRQLYEDSGNHRQSLLARLESTLETAERQIQDLPPLKRKRGRPAGAKNKKTSIRRDKSQFEYTEGRKCSICKQAGHNARTCPAEINAVMLYCYFGAVQRAF
jgi:hypothetical protein